MTAYAILAAVAAVLGAMLGLRRKASRERDARVQAELDRDVAKGRADTAQAQVAVVAEVEQHKVEAAVLGEDYKAEVAALATAAHAAAVAATPPAGVPVTREPTPAEVIAAADEARRNARTRAKIAAGRKGRP